MKNRTVKNMKTAKHIYLISDSTGELGDRFTNALLTQFPNDKIIFKKFNFVTGREDLTKIFSKISLQESALFHTVIDRDLKSMIAEFGKKNSVPQFDLTGPPTDFLVKHLKLKPEWNLSTIHPINEQYEQRIDAIEYMIGHDDGAGGLGVKKADAILLGLSRSSKTPTSMYLATKGFKIANIPIVREVDQREIFEKLKGDRRVIGLFISAQKLCEVRMKRVAELGVNPQTYTDLKEIQKEVLWVKRVYDQYGWKTIDVTDRAIEETAALIMKHIQHNS